MPTPADALAEEILHARARREPAWATQVGLRGFDHALADPTPEAGAAALRETEGFLRRAEALPPSHDREVLVATLRLERFRLKEIRARERNPDLAGALFDHLFHVLVAAHLDPREKADALAGRLEGGPAFLRAGRARFDPRDVPPLWVEGALRSVEGGPAFLDAVRGFASDAPPAARDRLLRALPAAEESLREHRAWLEDLHGRAKGDFALGRDRFAELLRLRLIPESPEEMADLGRRSVERFRAEAREAALTVLAEAGRDPGADPVSEALEVVRDDRPATFADALREYERSIAQAREFVRERGLAGMTDVPLDVVETPAFLRHLIPFAAYIPPARFATPRRGVYLVTPKVDLRAFPRADVRNTTVHEAYPGHHLHLARSATEASLPAFLADAPDLVEGWALYCELLMGEHGFTASPAERFVRARDALWRAVRIRLDAGLHAGGMSAREAAAELSRETGMPPEEAEAEVLRYTLEPGYNLSYLWGRLRLERLRREWLARGGDPRDLHDAILASGGAPTVLVEQAILAGAR